MIRIVPGRFLFAVFAVTTLADAARAQFASPVIPTDTSLYPATRTAKEQSRLLAAVSDMPRVVAAPAGERFGQTVALDRIEAAIRLANRHDLESLRRPVPAADLERLRADLVRTTGRALSAAQVQAMTDYGHAMLRETPYKSLAYKLARSTHAGRPGFHGLVAELAEARARQMVLTRDRRSGTFDLTEDRVRPRTAQLKIYADDGAAFRDMLRDLAPAPEAARRGIMTQRAIASAEAHGRLRRRVINGTAYFVTTSPQRTEPPFVSAPTGSWPTTRASAS
jgi:hypothetical protein